MQVLDRPTPCSALRWARDANGHTGGTEENEAKGKLGNPLDCRASLDGGGGNRTRAWRCETLSRIAPLPRNRPE